MNWLPAALPDALLFACFGFVVALAALGIVVGWLARYVRDGAVALWRRAGGLWWPPVAPRPATEPLPKRIPAPPLMSPRPDLEAALRARVRTLNSDIDRILDALPTATEPTQADIEHVIAAATGITRAAAPADH